MITTQKQELEKKNIINYLVDALHDYKEFKRNIEYENFLILKSTVEKRLASIAESEQFNKIFTDKIIDRINNTVKIDFINDIIKNKKYNSNELYGWELDSKSIYGTSFHINGKEFLLLQLYSLANKISCENATKQLADYLNIKFTNCSDIKSSDFEKTVKLESNFNLTFTYNFYNQNDKLIFEVCKFINKNRKFGLLLHRLNYYSLPSYVIPKVLQLFNLNWIYHNPDALILLIDSIPIAYEQQQKCGYEYLFNKVKKEQEFWNQEKEEFKTAASFYNKTDMRLCGSQFTGYFKQAEQIVTDIDTLMEEIHQSTLHQETCTNTYRKTDIVWTAWYKESHTIFRVNWRPLEGRRVNYIHFGEMDKESLFEKMIAVYAGIYANTAHLELQFIYLPKADNHIEPDKNGAEFYSPKELLLASHKVGIIVPDILQSKLEELLRGIRKNKKEDFLIDPILGKKAFNVLIGMRGSGKSWVGLSIAYSLATGRSLMKKWIISKPCKVLYLNGEVDAELMQLRELDIKKMYSKNKKLENVIVKNDKNINLLEEKDQIKILKYLHNASLKTGNQEMPVSVLILDNLLFLSENGAETHNWRKIQKWISKLIQDKNISIILLHHTNDKKKSYGTQNIENAADNVILLTKIKNNKYLEILIKEEKNKRKLELPEFKLCLDTGKRPRWIEEDKFNTVLNWRMSEPEKKNKVVELRQKNNTWPDIANMFGVSLSSIEKFAQVSGISKSNKITYNKKTNEYNGEV